VATDAVTPAALLDQADAARNAGQGARAAALYAVAADRAGRDGDLDAEVAAVLGLARCQEYNVTPGALPVQLYGPYARTADPVQRAVRKTLIAAVARIAEVDPWLGRHLRDRLRTGTECRYETDPDNPVTWVVRTT
jgi:hypothetical protein